MKKNNKENIYNYITNNLNNSLYLEITKASLSRITKISDSLTKKALKELINNKKIYEIKKNNKFYFCKFEDKEKVEINLISEKYIESYEFLKNKRTRENFYNFNSNYINDLFKILNYQEVEVFLKLAEFISIGKNKLGCIFYTNEVKKIILENSKINKDNIDEIIESIENKKMLLFYNDLENKEIYEIFKKANIKIIILNPLYVYKGYKEDKDKIVRYWLNNI